MAAASAFAQRPGPQLLPDKVGLLKNTEKAFSGYNLIAPLPSGTTWLVDNDGQVVHSWVTEYSPGNSVYLLSNGNLLRSVKPPNASGFGQGGAGGGIQLLDWDGNTIWEHLYANDRHRQHHDIQPLPNGNILAIAWEKKTRAEAIQAGRNSRWLEGNELWPEKIVELKPRGKWDAEVVWEWHIWDHLIQDHDQTKDNFGVVKDHPELIDINFTARGQADWNHVNSIDYHPEFDQIILSSHNQHEFWVIDHSTTTEEAAGHKGGRSAKGGDILYRWGNPYVYYAGERPDQQLFSQHDARWIPKGFPNAGHITVFNNGSSRANRGWSSVDRIKPPADEKGVYALIKGQAFAPAKATWSYTAPNKRDFHAHNISGAHALPNGNTLICSGPNGRLFEVTEAKEIVWEYILPSLGGGNGSGRRVMATSMFRVTRYAKDHAAFKGRELKPRESLEQAFARATRIRPAGR
ncbi:MAG: aryl-sulfate sulfotransferase [Limisphaerales bacterium]